jgi:hypothetical protein
MTDTPHTIPLLPLLADDPCLLLSLIAPWPRLAGKGNKPPWRLSAGLEKKEGEVGKLQNTAMYGMALWRITARHTIA